MKGKLKDEEQLTKDLEGLIKKLYTRIQGTDEEKREAINRKVEAELNFLKMHKYKSRDQKKQERIDKFKKRAGEIPDDLDTLMEEFGYNSTASVCRAMKKNGIYGRIKIRKAIQEKSELGLNEEEANAQIAQEGNVTIQAVERIRQELNKTKSKDTKVLPVVEAQQKSKQERQNEAKESRQREIEQRKWEQELQQVEQENLKREQEIQQETEDFLKMAREFCPSNLINGRFQHIDAYDMILIRRKHKILSREEVEELIETTTLTDEEIAQKANGEVIAVKKVRESIRKKKELIADITEVKRNFIMSLIKQGYTNVKQIAARAAVPVETIEAVKEEYYKSEKTKINLNSPIRKSSYKGQINMLRSIVNSIKTTELSKSSEINGRIKKILVEFEDLLQKPDYALLTYGYLKVGEYLKAIEFAEEYLGLQEPTIQGVTDKINKILEEAKTEQEKAKEVANKSVMTIGEN